MAIRDIKSTTERGPLEILVDARAGLDQVQPGEGYLALDLDENRLLVVSTVAQVLSVRRLAPISGQWLSWTKQLIAFHLEHLAEVASKNPEGVEVILGLSQGLIKDRFDPAIDDRGLSFHKIKTDEVRETLNAFEKMQKSLNSIQGIIADMNLLLGKLPGVKDQSINFFDPCSKTPGLEAVLLAAHVAMVATGCESEEERKRFNKSAILEHLDELSEFWIQRSSGVQITDSVYGVLTLIERAAGDKCMDEWVSNLAGTALIDLAPVWESGSQVSLGEFDKISSRWVGAVQESKSYRSFEYYPTWSSSFAKETGRDRLSFTERIEALSFGRLAAARVSTRLFLVKDKSREFYVGPLTAKRLTGYGRKMRIKLLP